MSMNKNNELLIFYRFDSHRLHQTRKIRTCFHLEKGSDFSFSDVRGVQQ
nr:MAG TPA: hypothetical protein [Caudoviricetes sp.]